MEYLDKLPQGLLPKWMMLVAAAAVFNSIQSFATSALNKRLYSKATEQVNGLSSRTFGVWTLTSAVVRFYAAVNINDPRMYDLALYTYYIAAFHFSTEVIVYKTARWGVVSPIIVASTSIIWMTLQRSFYLN